MSTDKEYTPTPADEAIYAGLLSTQVVGVIQQVYIDGKLDLETYNKLFDAAKKADTQVQKLVGILEEKREISAMAEAFRKASRSSRQEKEE